MASLGTTGSQLSQAQISAFIQLGRQFRFTLPIARRANIQCDGSNEGDRLPFQVMDAPKVEPNRPSPFNGAPSKCQVSLGV